MMFTGFPKTNNSTVSNLNGSSVFSEKVIVDKSVQGPSKFLTRKWREKDMSMHREKLETMRSVVACQQHPVPINKLKGEQMVEERYIEIERENRMLFEKITQIHLKGVATNLLTSKAGSSRKLSTISTTLS